MLAEWTGLEPATPGVTGRYSDQLNYHSWQRRLLFRAKSPVLQPAATDLCLTSHGAMNLGDPTGIRTPVLTVKG